MGLYAQEARRINVTLVDFLVDKVGINDDNAKKMAANWLETNPPPELHSEQTETKTPELKTQPLNTTVASNTKHPHERPFKKLAHKRFWMACIVIGLLCLLVAFFVYIKPPYGLRRTSFKKFETKNFYKIGLQVNLPINNDTWSNPYTLFDNEKALCIVMQTFYHGFEPVENDHLVWLSIYRLEKHDFENKFPHWFFNYLPLNEWSEDDKQKQKKDVDFLNWVSQNHESADVYERGTEFNSRGRYQYILVRWFKTKSKEVIFCSGTVYVDTYLGTPVEKDINGLKKIMDSIRPIGSTVSN